MRIPAVFWILAIGVAVYVRVSFLMSLPAPLLQPDSTGYFVPAIEMIYEGHFKVPSQRSAGYPVLLLLAMKSTGSILSVMILQHGLSMLIAFLSAWIARKTFQVSSAMACAVFFLVSILPRSLTYAHTLLTDLPYAAIAITGITLWLAAQRLERPVLWGLLGVILWMALLVRPIGVSLILGVVAVWGFDALRGRLGRGPLLCALVLSVLWVGSASVNLSWRGFWGLQQFSGVPLFGAAARYLDPALATSAEERMALRAIYTQYPEKMTDANWVRFHPEGPVTALRRVIPDEKELDRRLLKLSLSAIRHQPVQFARDQGVALIDFLWKRSQRPAHLLPKEVSLVEGLSILTPWMDRYPALRASLVWRPSMAIGESRRPLYPYEPAGISWLFWPWVFAVRWAALAAVLATPFLVMSERDRHSALSLWGAILIHILLTNLGGDGDGRHALPLEPLFIVLTVAGLAAGYQRYCPSLKARLQ